MRQGESRDEDEQGKEQGHFPGAQPREDLSGHLPPEHIDGEVTVRL